ncbi:MAG: PAS domain-containing protein [Candidatus Riflebacteria bacterium]|nr:PAS domain-containing protein [Candidatus Riflebacteria bacterium]
MNEFLWLDGIKGSITVTDIHGTIIFMNESAQETFKSDGGKELIGKNLMDCHPESAREKINNLLAEKKTNAYTIEKKGKKKLIWQTPWMKDGACAGLVEISLEIPFEMPNFIRK